MASTEIKIGDKAQFSKTVSESDVYQFAGITGDMNPAHINEEYCKESYFGKRIAHGMLSAGFISAVIAMKLPGPGSIYMGQSLKFVAPVYIGDTVTAEVEVTEFFKDGKAARLRTTCTNQKGDVVLDGEAEIYLPR